MITKVFDRYCDLPGWTRRPLWKMLHKYLDRKDDNAEVIFMNYGYAVLDPYAESIELESEDESQRYCIQLYHHVVSAVNLNGLRVLEIGCGRGGVHHT